MSVCHVCGAPQSIFRTARLCGRANYCCLTAFAARSLLSPLSALPPPLLSRTRHAIHMDQRSHKSSLWRE